MHGLGGMAELVGPSDVAAASAWRIHGADLGAINVPGKPEAVTTTRLVDPVAPDKPLVLPAHSITILEFSSR